VLAGVRNLNLDETSAVRPDSHCDFGDPGTRRAERPQHGAEVPQAGRVARRRIFRSAFLGLLSHWPDRQRTHRSHQLVDQQDPARRARVQELSQSFRLRLLLHCGNRLATSRPTPLRGRRYAPDEPGAALGCLVSHHEGSESGHEAKPTSEDTCARTTVLVPSTTEPLGQSS
jgi:hypothetical protein